jgi:superfamily I DNA/RNA helicase
MTGLPIPKGRQREVVYLPANGHVVVLGTAGSGKTTMALLRAIQLQKQHANSDDKTLLVTFNRMLVSYMNSFRESLPEGLDVEHYHKVARGYLNSKGRMQRRAILTPEQRQIIIRQAVEERLSPNEEPIAARTFSLLVQEIRWLARFGIRTLEEYIKVEPVGRKGTRIALDSRPLVWDVYQRYQKLREERGYLYDWNDIAIAVEDELRLDNSDWKYRHVIIDEGQDFSPIMLRSLVAAIPDNGSLTFFGDVAQQVYGIRVSWQDAGFKPKKVWKFKENYRNTKEIADLALAISEMPHFLGQPDIVTPNAPRAAGPLPTLVKFKDSKKEIPFVLKQAAQSGRTQQVAILVQKRSQVQQLLRQLRRYPNLSVSKLDRKGRWQWKPGVMIGTYQSAKGLEFDMVIMPFCDSQFWPDAERIREKGIDEAQAEEMRLLYVGVTRAKTRLLITCSGELTNLLPHQWSMYDVQER